MEIFKYLGVLLSRNLSWSDHISELCIKARKILGLLYRQFYDSVDIATLKVTGYNFNFAHAIINLSVYKTLGCKC